MLLSWPCTLALQLWHPEHPGHVWVPWSSLGILDNLGTQGISGSPKSQAMYSPAFLWLPDYVLSCISLARLLLHDSLPSLC